MSERWLVLGSTGQVGAALMHEAREAGLTASGTGHSRAADYVLDLGDAAAIRSLLDELSPTTVLVVGAYTHVDGCEEDPEQSRRVNREGPETVAAWAQGAGARVVHYSTDYVFDGTAGPYREDDRVNPLSVYGRDKRAAEEAVLSLGNRGLVVRTAWVYSWEVVAKNFVQRLVQNLAGGQAATIPADQWGNPTYAPELARATRLLLAEGACGLFHVAGQSILTRYAFARRIADAFSVPDDKITGVATAELHQKAPRPLRAGLDVSRVRRVLGWAPAGPETVLPVLARRYHRRADWPT